jgi:hypothetical protein
MSLSVSVSSLQKILSAAVDNLFINQPNIFDFTSETGQSEWNLSHHLANEINKLLPNLDCDLDVIKVNIGNKRPDIIFHKRGSNKNNFLVIEVKRGGYPSEIKEDISKIRSYWFGERLCYKFGAVINLKKKNYEIKLFSNSGLADMLE